MSNKKSLEDRKKFEDDLNKLLDISHPNLEKTLALGNLEGRKSEDLKFLQDQRGERKMTMGKLDEEQESSSTQEEGCASSEEGEASQEEGSATSEEGHRDGGGDRL